MAAVRARERARRRSPLVKAVGEDQAAVALVGAPEGGALGGRLRTRVDHLQSDVLTPAHEGTKPQRSSPRGDVPRDRPSRQAVVGRGDVVAPPDLDGLSDGKASPDVGGRRGGERVPAAHGELDERLSARGGRTARRVRPCCAAPSPEVGQAAEGDDDENEGVEDRRANRDPAQDQGEELDDPRPEREQPRR